MLRDALLENIHRANLNPLEEAAAYQQLLEEFGATHEELARRIGRSRPADLQHDPAAEPAGAGAAAGRRRRAVGRARAGAARRWTTPEQQEALATRIVAEGLSVAGDRGGGTSSPARPPPRGGGAADQARDPRARGAGATLSDNFETRVRVDIGRRKGRIVIEFATVDDLGGSWR